MLAAHEANNDLERLYNYFIKEANGDPIPFGTWEKISLFLELFGASGGIYSYPPAKQYSKGKPSWLSYSLQITNPLSNTLFLSKATDDLFNTIAMETKVPQEISDIIRLTPKKDLLLKYGKMLLGSVVCAIPFGVVTYLFPLPHCDSKACIGTIVTHSVVANTILHAISWNLILTPQYWFYRLPTLPLEKLWSLLKTSCLSPEEEQNAIISRSKEQIYQKYRDHLGKFFGSGGRKIVEGYLNDSDSNAATLLRSVRREATLQTFIDTVARYQPEDVEQRPGNFRACVSTTNKALQNYIVPILGALLIVIGCIGLIFDPIYVGQAEHLSLAVSIALGILPSYSTAVLCSFYGSAVMGQVYDYLTTWSSSLRSKFSLEARLNPVTFSLFLLFNLYVSAFAYGTAVELIETVFGASRWDSIRPYLVYIAIPALQILSLIPLLNLFDTVAGNVKAKFASESDDKEAARLLVKSNLFSQRLQQLDGDSLMTSLDNIPAAQVTALGLTKQNITTDIAFLDNLEKTIVPKRGSGCCSSFWSRPSAEEQPLLSAIVAEPPAQSSKL